MPFSDFFSNFQHKLNIILRSVSNITMLHLRKLWLQNTSANILEKSSDETEVVKTVLS